MTHIYFYWTPNTNALQEFVIFSGHLVPAQGVNRGRMVLGGTERWLRAFHAVVMRFIVRNFGIRFGMLGVPTALLLLFGQVVIAVAIFALYLAFALAFMTGWYHVLTRRTVDAYRSSGLSPGVYENGVELPAFFTVIGRLRVPTSFFSFPWSRTVFLPFVECARVDTEGGTLAGFLQDTVTVWLKGGSRLWFPTGLLGGDGVAYLRASLGRAPPPSAPPMNVYPRTAVGADQWHELKAP